MGDEAQYLEEKHGVDHAVRQYQKERDSMALSGDNKTASEPVVGQPVEVSVPKPSALNPFIARDLSLEADYLSMIIYGDNGVGKTYLAGSAAFVDDYSDVLYLALEGGERGLKQLIKDGKKRGIDVGSRILVIPVSTFKQYANIHKFMTLHVKFRDQHDIINLRRLEGQIRGFEADQIKDDKFLEQAIPKPKMIRTVITDSLTEAQKYCMYQLLGIDPLTQSIDMEPDSAEWKQWGQSREMVQFLVRRFRDLLCNSFFICTQDINQDAQKRMYFEPMLPGKLSTDVRGMVDCVGYYVTIPQDTGTVRRLFLVGGNYGNSNVAAKHRFGSNLTTPYIDNPTMETIWHLDND